MKTFLGINKTFKTFSDLLRFIVIQDKMNTPTSSLNYKQKGRCCYHSNNDLIILQGLVKGPNHLHSISRTFIGEKILSIQIF